MAGRVTRIPAGHPEGYLEGFATIYSDAAELIWAKLEGRAPDPGSDAGAVRCRRRRRRRVHRGGGGLQPQEWRLDQGGRPMTTPYRIGMIGYGFMGRAHSNA